MQLLLVKWKIFSMFHLWYLFGGCFSSCWPGWDGPDDEFSGIFVCPLSLPSTTVQQSSLAPTWQYLYLYFLNEIISNGWIGLYHKSFWHFHNNPRPPSSITCFSDYQYYWTPPLLSSGSSRNVNIKTQQIKCSKKINIKHTAGNNTVASQKYLV